MPFALRPLPGSSNVITDASDFYALSDAGCAEHYDLWDYNSTSILYIHAYATPLEKWLTVLGAVADPDLATMCASSPEVVLTSPDVSLGASGRTAE